MCYSVTMWFWFIISVYISFNSVTDRCALFAIYSTTHTHLHTYPSVAGGSGTVTGPHGSLSMLDRQIVTWDMI